jgi:hypothetical protein
LNEKEIQIKRLESDVEQNKEHIKSLEPQRLNEVFIEIQKVHTNNYHVNEYVNELRQQANMDRKHIKQLQEDIQRLKE